MAKVDMTRDPIAIAERLQKVPGRSLILGLDLGTSCGWAATWWRPGDPVVPEKMEMLAGQLDLSAGPYESGAIRFLRLRHFLAAANPGLVAYEMVRNTPPGAVTKFNAAGLLARAMTSAQLFGAFQGVLSAWCEEAGVPCTGVPIGTIKKRATNKGNAGKEQIIAATNAAFGLDLDPEGYESSGVDNISDACWIVVLAAEQYGSGLSVVAEEEPTDG